MTTTLTTIQKMDNRYSDCYIVYTRKSTDDAENQKNSIAYQKLEAKRYYENEKIRIASVSIPGFCVDGIIEEHHSGFKQDDGFETNEDTITYKVSRPKFLSLVNLLRQRKFKGIVCLCWDRLSRNEADDVLIKKLISQGIDIRFVQASYDLTSAGALHMDIDGMFSRHYSRVISEKVKDSHKKLLAEGKCLYSAPIGYLNEGSNSKPFDPGKAPIVKRIFELYATGEWSFSSLAKWAGHNGLISRSIRRKRTKEEKSNGVQLEEIPKIIRPVTEKTIEKILNNHFYAGKLLHKGKLIDSHAHLPLIDLSLYFKVVAMLKKKNRTIHFPELSFFTYRGLIKCAICKRSYSPYITKGITYYQTSCISGCLNNVKNISEKSITGKIGEIISRIHFSDSEISAIEEEARSALDKISDRRNKELADLRRNLDKILSDFDYLAKDKLSLLRTGVYTPQQILEEEGRLTILLEQAKSKINVYSLSAKAMLDYVIAFSELVKNASTYFQYALDTEKRELTVQVFTELYVENGEIKFVAKYGYDVLLKRFDCKIPNYGAPQYVFLELESILAELKTVEPMLRRCFESFELVNRG